MNIGYDCDIKDTSAISQSIQLAHVSQIAFDTRIYGVSIQIIQRQ
jgi:hypothetical protein